MSELLEINPEIGYPLEGEWTGYRAHHVGHNDCHRIIWRIDPAEDDYTREAPSQVIPAIIVRVGPKMNARGRTLFQQGLPPD